MKKFLAAIVSLSLLSTPAMARDHHHRHGNNTGEVVAGALIGGILGYAIGSSSRNNPEYEQNREYRKQSKAYRRAYDRNERRWRHYRDHSYRPRASYDEPCVRYKAHGRDPRTGEYRIGWAEDCYVDYEYYEWTGWHGRSAY